MRLRRSEDKGWLCYLAMRVSQLWDWIDRRQVDAYIISGIILYITIRITEWAAEFAERHSDKPGLEIAAIIAAIMTPWSALQAAAVKFLFDARKGSFE